ncbi:HAMP domain-containing histidine kinase [Paenibacillus sp. SYP-B3998]|uniref:histidine kinase n=1 Tax=Paenibacillus sp. SYP-B3998 TaxID=2678564 RepID=A0A6G3ZX36_9BACL|nr:HAMP domain-containing sensor histidine kinase [Paenibacillus sp. SYP-B3998]NEW05977.1 HAMP domain-containing histidine kinase [Paenibacillus sp. SYP-B3998]
MRGLYARFAIAFIGIASGVILISTIAFIVETHYHFSLYKQQATDSGMSSPAFDNHFEQALVQSVLWSAILGIVFSIVISLVIAKKVTSPLIHMKRIAERMAGGEFTARTTIKGNDELAQLGASLNYLAEQLHSQEQLRKTLTADVAHELRTPLATLKSHVEAMIEGVWEPTPKRLASCYEEIERLRYLVGDLEKLTEMESSHFTLVLNKENMSAILEHHVEASRAAFEQKGVGLNVYSDALVQVRVDKQRIGQVFVNLLMNALKFTPHGGEVTIDLHNEDQLAVFCIRDTGIGICDKDIPYVFERFYRADKSRDRKTGGSGIGLTIVKRLVEAHSGTVHLQSAVEEGTTVTIRFPLN